MRFEGQRALVTGAASGIGAATARLLAREGATIVAVDRDPMPGDPHAICGDVADEAMWDAAAGRIGAIDLAVVNAGVAGAGAIAGLSFAEWRRILAVNLDGAFLTLRAAMRAIRDGGAIVVVASAAGIRAEPGTAAYGASKAGAIQLARVAAREGAARRIRVNAVAPGGVETPIWQAVPLFREVAARDGEAAAFAALAAGTPAGRFAGADEIAAQIAHLLAPESASVTGALLVADGGYSI